MLVGRMGAKSPKRRPVLSKFEDERHARNGELEDIRNTLKELSRRISLVNLNHLPNHSQKLLAILISRRRNRHWTFSAHNVECLHHTR